MKMTYMLWRKTIAACSLAALSACSILPQAQIRDNYRLPVSTFPASTEQATSVDWSLRIAVPQSGQLLDSRHILIIRNDNQISAYKGAQWSEPAPVLVGDRILDAFRANGRIPFVHNETANLKSHLELQSDLRSFHVEYRENRPFVYIQLDASLVANASRSTVATHSFTIMLPAQGEQVPQIVEAFGAATDQLSQKIVEWTIREAKTGATP